MQADSNQKRGHLRAMHDFRRARQRGALESIVAHLTGRSDRLLSYHEVSDSLQTGGAVDRGLHQVPLDAIVGSVGRYADFTRRFLPLREEAADRWTRVHAAFQRVEDIPPINVYQLGDVYFVLDGNHRVSVARTLGATHIPAYVTEIETPVPFTPDVDTDDLIIQAQFAGFLAETGLDKTRPEADLRATAPGQYRLLNEQIEQHAARLREQAEAEGTSPPSLEEAASSWYVNVYLPLVELIRRRRLLQHFPGRTETDLYVWILRHRKELEEELGWELETNRVASDLLQRFSPTPDQLLSRVKERIATAITPAPLEGGPPPGTWRQTQVADRERADLFLNILVLLSDDSCGWQALEQALLVGEREGAQVDGLYVAAEAEEAVRARFEAQLATSGVAGELTSAEGRLLPLLYEQAAWQDLIVLGLCEPPGTHSTDRLRSRFGALVRGAGRPVLAVPGPPTTLQKPLLAYDGSPKAKEALFVAAYLAAKWELPLTVLVAVAPDEAGGEEKAADLLEDARYYLLARGVSPTCLARQGEPAPLIAATAEAHNCDLIVMGGYGFSPLLEVVLGSTVDAVVRYQRWPVLICR